MNRLVAFLTAVFALIATYCPAPPIPPPPTYIYPYVQVGYNGTDGYVLFYSDDGATDHWAKWTVPTMTGNVTFTFPASQPTAGILSIDGSGNIVSGAGNMTAGNITISGDDITSNTGRIDFSNEDLVTTGNLTVGCMTFQTATISSSTGNLSFSDENLTTTGNVSGATLTGSTSGVFGNITITGAGLSSDTAGISFGAEDLSTTGNLTVGNLTLSGAGMSSDTTAISFGAENLTIGGDVSIGGGNVAITAATGAMTVEGEFTLNDANWNQAYAGTVFSTSTAIGSSGTVWNYKNSRGSLTVPTGTLSGDEILIRYGKPYAEATDYVNSFTEMVSAAQNITATAWGTTWEIRTSKLDSTTAVKHLGIDSAGRVEAPIALIVGANLTLDDGSITDASGNLSFGDENLVTTGTLGCGVLTGATGSALGNLTLGNGSITDASGAISFGDENLLTTGTLGCGVLTGATGSALGNLTLGNGSITDASGAISFGDENLSTSGTITGGNITISGAGISSNTTGISFGAEHLSTTGNVTAATLNINGQFINLSYAGSGGLLMTSAGGGATNYIELFQSRGTVAAPTQSQSGDTIFDFQGYGYGTGPASFYRAYNQIVKTAEAFTVSARGVTWEVDTCAIGEMTATKRLGITSNGSVEVVGNLTLGNLTLSGDDITSSSGTIDFSDDHLTTTGNITCGTLNATTTLFGNITISIDDISSDTGHVDMGTTNLTFGNLTVSSAGVQTTGAIPIAIEAGEGLTLGSGTGNMTLASPFDWYASSGGNMSLTSTGDMSLSADNINTTGNVSVGNFQATSVVANLTFADPGTSANSYDLIFTADSATTAQTAKIGLIYGADPYLRISVDDDAASPALMATLDIHDTLMSFGTGTAGVDYIFTFNGETNDGNITFMEDENRFDFSGDVNVASGKVYKINGTTLAASDVGAVANSLADVAGDRIVATADNTWARQAALTDLGNFTGAMSEALVSGSHCTGYVTGNISGITFSGLNEGESCTLETVNQSQYDVTFTGIEEDWTGALTDANADRALWVIRRWGYRYRASCKELIDDATVLLLHCNQADANTTFTDSADDDGAPHTMTAAGNAQGDTGITKLGTGTMLLDGTGDYVEAPDSNDWRLGYGLGNRFTIDFWVYPANVSIGSCAIAQGNTTARSWMVKSVNTDGGRWEFFASSNGSTWDIADGVSCGNMSLTTWQHYAVVRDGTAIRTYKDGTMVTDTTGSGDIYASSEKLYVGWENVGNVTFNGNFDEIRISNGQARWPSGNFTVRTTEY